MARIFLGLAIFASLLVIGNLLYAFAVGDFGAASGDYYAALDALHELKHSDLATPQEVESQTVLVDEKADVLLRRRDEFWPHVWLGIIACLVAMLVNSISITYFIGTNRWCREVVEAYDMDRDLARKSQRLKRTTFPWALLGIGLTLAIAGFGAAADPFASAAHPPRWVPWHYLLGMAGAVLIPLAFVIQIGAVGRNYEIIQTILREAERIRGEREAG